MEFIRKTRTATIAGSLWMDAGRSEQPLIIALHGGGFTRRYYLEGAPSLVDSATAVGFDVALLDRPGYGESHFHHRDGDILHDNATALAEAIEQCQGEYAPGRPVVLIGHSIGGAIALMIAARGPAWLNGVSVSGIGDVQPAAVRAFISTPPPADAPPPDLARLFFLTPKAATVEAVAAIGRATVPFIPEELMAISSIWPDGVSEVLSEIAVPTQILLAEQEALWETGASVADRMAGALCDARHQDIAIIPDVAHCIEYHPEAPAYYARILNFASSL